MYQFGVTNTGQILTDPLEIKQAKSRKVLDDNITIQYSQIRYKILVLLEFEDGRTRYMFSTYRTINNLKMFGELVKTTIVKENINEGE